MSGGNLFKSQTNEVQKYIRQAQTMITEADHAIRFVEWMFRLRNRLFHAKPNLIEKRRDLLYSERKRNMGDASCGSYW